MDKVFFYSLQDAAEKLNRTEEDVRELARQGRLSEFRDGSTLLLSANEVEAAISSISPGKGRSKSAASARLKV
jgi:excisionase family DNA binding protein